MSAIRGTLAAAMLVIAAFSLLAQTPTASAAICTAPSCHSGGPNGCDINLGDCNGGSCNVNTGDCSGGSCVANVGDCSCYDPNQSPCSPSPGDNCSFSATGNNDKPLSCGCVVNAGTCNGDCTLDQPPKCGGGGNCVVNGPTSDCSGECTNVTGTYPPNACGNGGTCTVNVGECGAGCAWSPSPDAPTSPPASGCGDGGDCTVNTAFCDGVCEPGPPSDPRLRCADGGCENTINSGTCRRPYTILEQPPAPAQPA